MSVYTYSKVQDGYQITITLPFRGDSLTSLVIGPPSHFSFGNQSWSGRNIRDQLPTNVQSYLDNNIGPAWRALKEELFIPPWQTLNDVEHQEAG